MDFQGISEGLYETYEGLMVTYAYAGQGFSYLCPMVRKGTSSAFEVVSLDPYDGVITYNRNDNTTTLIVAIVCIPSDWVVSYIGIING